MFFPYDINCGFTTFAPAYQQQLSMITTQEILQGIGQFSTDDVLLFEQYTTRKTLYKNDLLLRAGELCTSIYYLLSGVCCQYQVTETEETIINLHTSGEWAFNESSIISQQPSSTSIKIVADVQVIELTLKNLHQLIILSNAFLQFGKLFAAEAGQYNTSDLLTRPNGLKGSV